MFHDYHFLFGALPPAAGAGLPLFSGSATVPNVYMTRNPMTIYHQYFCMNDCSCGSSGADPAAPNGAAYGAPSLPITYLTPFATLP